MLEQAEPRFKDKKRFVEMADPLLEGRYPLKGLYQALAIAAMCLQEDATNRPLISDVVTALEYLANPNPNQNPNPNPTDVDSKEAAPAGTGSLPSSSAGSAKEEGGSTLQDNSEREAHSSLRHKGESMDRM